MRPLSVASMRSISASRVPARIWGICVLAIALHFWTSESSSFTWVLLLASCSLTQLPLSASVNFRIDFGTCARM
jgi:hypothetical protein